MRSRAFLLALAAPILAATTAPAGPIRLTYERYGSGQPVSILLPDDFAANGFTFTLGSDRAVYSGPNWTQEEWNSPSGPPVKQGVLNGSVFGRLTFDREPLGSGSTAPDSPAIWVQASLTGPMWSRGTGAMTGWLDKADVVSRVVIGNTTTPRLVGPEDYERWERELGISRAFLEYLASPGALKFSGAITGGASNLLPINLTVGPMPIPAPVPEPSSCAAWGLAVAGAWAWRRRRAA